MSQQSRAWYRELTPYHWFVFIVASAAWSFDCLDQRLFSLARNPALEALMPGEAPGVVQATGKQVTAMFLVGWGIGGMIFGALGDRYGRARMLTITVLLYSCFTGLTCLSRNYWDFAIYRFMTGVGVGGVFGLAVALIAETLNDTARVGALGTLQILSTIGNLLAAGFNSLFNYLAGPADAWRWMFAVGALPAFLVIFTGRYLREPDRWLRLKETGQLPTGSLLAPYAGLLKDRQWRKNLIVGTVIASTGVIGMWAIAEYAVDLQRYVFNQHYARELLADDGAAAITDADVIARLKEDATFAKQVKDRTSTAITQAYLLYMIGAAVGMWMFTRMTMAVGRRMTFALGFTAALASTLVVYGLMDSPMDAYWMTPLMGAAQLATFAGFAIYLPELFPSRLRSTGTSFCYNFGRFAAAAGSLVSATLATRVYGSYGSPLMERYSAMTMCAIFLIGLAILPFSPETKDQPLPE
jgi:MFS family permease